MAKTKHIGTEDIQKRFETEDACRDYAMAERDSNYILTGIVELDDTYLGKRERINMISAIIGTSLRFMIFDGAMNQKLLIGAGPDGWDKQAQARLTNRYAGGHLAVISSSIIGGASLSGGCCSMTGAFFGTVFMALLRNSFNLFDVEAQWQDISVGANLVIVVMIDEYLLFRKQRALGK